MVNHAGLLANFWEDALVMAVEVHNIVQKRNESIALYENLGGVKHSVTHFKVFGCRIYRRVSNKQLKKFEPKAKKTILMNLFRQEITESTWNKKVESQPLDMQKGMKLYFLKENGMRIPQREVKTMKMYWNLT